MPERQNRKEGWKKRPQRKGHSGAGFRSGIYCHSPLSPFYACIKTDQRRQLLEEYSNPSKRWGRTTMWTLQPIHTSIKYLHWDFLPASTGLCGMECSALCHKHGHKPRSIRNVSSSTCIVVTDLHTPLLAEWLTQKMFTSPQSCRCSTCVMLQPIVGSWPGINHLSVSEHQSHSPRSSCSFGFSILWK